MLLRKGVYPSEYMDEWEKFNEISLPENKDFYSNLNMEDVTDSDYNHSKTDFEIKVLKQKIWVYIMICILKAIHYNCLIFLKTLKNGFRNLSIRPGKIFFSSRISTASSFKKD